jgi:CDP-glucose 4,6-dehydratase
MEVILDFWQDKRVFLTGHTGFKGSWLSLWLQSLGADLTGYALNPSTNPSMFNVAKVKDGMNSIIGDICDLDTLKDAIREARPEIVIHMAAQPLVRYSYANPVETYATNVMGTVHLMEAVRNTKSVKVLVNVTSDKCYENLELARGYREDEAMGGYDPYSNSKGCAELVTAAYRSSFFNPKNYQEHGVAVASARAGNVIGGGDWSEDRLIPDALKAFEKDLSLIIRNPRAIRPWQHVLEPLSGYLRLAQVLYEKGPAFASGWNFGPLDKDNRSVEEVISLLIKEWGSLARWEEEGQEQPYEATLLSLDISKAQSKLRWSPKWNLEVAIQKTAQWQKLMHKQEDMQKVSLAQIKEYQSI